jgi:hypothetical protein
MSNKTPTGVLSRKGFSLSLSLSWLRRRFRKCAVKALPTEASRGARKGVGVTRRNTLTATFAIFALILSLVVVGVPQNALATTESQSSSPAQSDAIVEPSNTEPDAADNYGDSETEPAAKGEDGSQLPPDDAAPRENETAPSADATSSSKDVQLDDVTAEAQPLVTSEQNIGVLRYGLDDTQNIASVLGCVSETCPAQIEIPTNVQSGGVTYTVTAIANYAFANQSSITNLVIASTITTVGIRAFFKMRISGNGNDQIPLYITFLSTTHPQLGWDFMGYTWDDRSIVSLVLVGCTDINNDTERSDCFEEYKKACENGHNDNWNAMVDSAAIQEPKLTLSGATLRGKDVYEFDFDTQFVGENATAQKKTLSIKNAGYVNSAELHFVMDTEDDEFSANYETMPNIRFGQAGDFEVEVKPNLPVGQYNATLTIDNAPRFTNVITINLHYQVKSQSSFALQFPTASYYDGQVYDEPTGPTVFPEFRYTEGSIPETLPVTIYNDGLNDISDVCAEFPVFTGHMYTDDNKQCAEDTIETGGSVTLNVPLVTDLKSNDYYDMMEVTVNGFPVHYVDILTYVFPSAGFKLSSVGADGVDRLSEEEPGVYSYSFPNRRVGFIEDDANDVQLPVRIQNDSETEDMTFYDVCYGVNGDTAPSCGFSVVNSVGSGSPYSLPKHGPGAAASYYNQNIKPSTSYSGQSGHLEAWQTYYVKLPEAPQPAVVIYSLHLQVNVIDRLTQIPLTLDTSSCDANDFRALYTGQRNPSAEEASAFKRELSSCAVLYSGDTDVMHNLEANGVQLDTSNARFEFEYPEASLSGTTAMKVTGLQLKGETSNLYSIGTGEIPYSQDLRGIIYSPLDHLIDGIWYRLSINEDDQPEATVLGCGGESTVCPATVTIPETVSHSGKDYTVNTIGTRAFFRQESITAITIPSTVGKIDEYALADIRTGDGAQSPLTIEFKGETPPELMDEFMSVTWDFPDVVELELSACANIVDIARMTECFNVWYGAYHNDRWHELVERAKWRSLGNATIYIEFLNVRGEHYNCGELCPTIELYKDNEKVDGITMGMDTLDGVVLLQVVSDGVYEIHFGTELNSYYSGVNLTVASGLGNAKVNVQPSIGVLGAAYYDSSAYCGEWCSSDVYTLYLDDFVIGQGSVQPVNLQIENTSTYLETDDIEVRRVMPEGGYYEGPDSQVVNSISPEGIVDLDLIPEPGNTPGMHCDQFFLTNERLTGGENFGASVGIDICYEVLGEKGYSVSFPTASSTIHNIGSAHSVSFNYAASEYPAVLPIVVTNTGTSNTGEICVFGESSENGMIPNDLDLCFDNIPVGESHTFEVELLSPGTNGSLYSLLKVMYYDDWYSSTTYYLNASIVPEKWLAASSIDTSGIDRLKNPRPGYYSYDFPDLEVGYSQDDAKSIALPVELNNISSYNLEVELGAQDGSYLPKYYTYERGAFDIDGVEDYAILNSGGSLNLKFTPIPGLPAQSIKTFLFINTYNIDIEDWGPSYTIELNINIVNSKHHREEVSVDVSGCNPADFKAQYNGSTEPNPADTYSMRAALDKCGKIVAPNGFKGFDNLHIVLDTSQAQFMFASSGVSGDSPTALKVSNLQLKRTDSPFSTLPDLSFSLAISDIENLKGYIGNFNHTVDLGNGTIITATCAEGHADICAALSSNLVLVASEKPSAGSEFTDFAAEVSAATGQKEALLRLFDIAFYCADWSGGNCYGTTRLADRNANPSTQGVMHQGATPVQPSGVVRITISNTLDVDKLNAGTKKYNIWTQHGDNDPHALGLETDSAHLADANFNASEFSLFGLTHSDGPGYPVTPGNASGSGGIDMAQTGTSARLFLMVLLLLLLLWRGFMTANRRGLLPAKSTALHRR